MNGVLPGLDGKVIADPRLKSRTLFMDECSVNLQGLINKQNDQMRAVENPRQTHDHVVIK